MYDVRNLKLWAYVRSSSPRPEVLIQQMKDGFQIMPDGEEIYAVKNTALDVWKTGISA